MVGLGLTAILCNTLQHSATYTATHCNTACVIPHGPAGPGYNSLQRTATNTTTHTAAPTTTPTATHCKTARVIKPGPAGTDYISLQHAAKSTSAATQHVLASMVDLAVTTIHCNIPQHKVFHTATQHVSSRVVRLHLAATHRNTLQPHCNSLQHAAT